jgi:hypothetical protein
MLSLALALSLGACTTAEEAEPATYQAPVAEGTLTCKLNGQTYTSEVGNVLSFGAVYVQSPGAPGQPNNYQLTSEVNDYKQRFSLMLFSDTLPLNNAPKAWTNWPELVKYQITDDQGATYRRYEMATGVLSFKADTTLRLVEGRFSGVLRNVASLADTIVVADGYFKGNYQQQVYR